MRVLGLLILTVFLTAQKVQANPYAEAAKESRKLLSEAKNLPPSSNDERPPSDEERREEMWRRRRAEAQASVDRKPEILDRQGLVWHFQVDGNYKGTPVKQDEAETRAGIYELGINLGFEERLTRVRRIPGKGLAGSKLQRSEWSAMCGFYVGGRSRTKVADSKNQAEKQNNNHINLRFPCSAEGSLGLGTGSKERPNGFRADLMGKLNAEGHLRPREESGVFSGGALTSGSKAKLRALDIQGLGELAAGYEYLHEELLAKAYLSAGYLGQLVPSDTSASSGKYVHRIPVGGRVRVDTTRVKRVEILEVSAGARHDLLSGRVGGDVTVGFVKDNVFYSLFLNGQGSTSASVNSRLKKQLDQQGMFFGIGIRIGNRDFEWPTH